jgi:hypothetical protein
LERENEELREAVERAARSLAWHQSGEATAQLKMQRDVLLVFARTCERWAGVELGGRASAALEVAGLDSDNGDSVLLGADPKLAIQLLLR